jgi:hypothetical protein
MTIRAGVCLLFLCATFLARRAAAEDRIQGQLVVDGKAVKLTFVHAFATKGFFDEKKQDVVVVMCDAPVPPDALRDPFARMDLVKAGKLHCVEQTIDADRQVINYKVQHNRFGKPEGGGSTYHVFEGKTFDGKTAAGRSRTTEPQKSFDDVPYSYDVTFSAAIEPIR